MRSPAKFLIALTALSGVTVAHAHSFGLPFSDHDVRKLIRTKPIAGVLNDFWYDYRTDIAEARQEYTKDLRRATDLEDRQDALVEFRTEVIDAEKDYAKEMRERGYRVKRRGSVRLLDY